MKSTLPIIKIASPCPARWDDMEGNERSRFCAQCSKRVYNFSQMQPEEIASFISQSEGRACVRFYRRKDGTMLLENCPVGAERLLRRVKLAVCSAVALFVFGITALLANSKPTSRDDTNSRIEAVWDDTVWKVKGWLGIQPTAMVGAMCPPIPKQKTQPPSKTAGN